MNLTLNPRLVQALEANRVKISEPREQMVQFNAVRVGPHLSKPATNVLLLPRHDDNSWEVFVDEDLSYTGDEPTKKRLFQGEPREGWKPLLAPEPLEGDVNDVVLRVLGWLASPMRGVARRASRAAPPSVPPLPPDPQLDRVGRFLGPGQLQAAAVELTSRQADAAQRVAATVMRGLAPTCPLILGPSGSGKTAVAVTAARRLIERGLFDRAFEISGAAVASGAVFWPQRDDRLRHIVNVLPRLERTLVLVEQVDLLLNHTEVPEALLSDCLDRGVKLIGIMRPDLTVYDLGATESLLRRIQPVHLDEPESHEVKVILAERLRQHPLADQVEVAPEVLPAVLTLAGSRPGANPGAAVGLLDAVLAHAAWAGTNLATPDDVYHLVHCDGDPETAQDDLP